MPKPSAIVYVDGFNLYKGQLESRPAKKWLNLVALFDDVLDAYDAHHVHYFTPPKSLTGHESPNFVITMEFCSFRLLDLTVNAGVDGLLEFTLEQLPAHAGDLMFLPGYRGAKPGSTKQEAASTPTPSRACASWWTRWPHRPIPPSLKSSSTQSFRTTEPKRLASYRKLAPPSRRSCNVDRADGVLAPLS